MDSSMCKARDTEVGAFGGTASAARAAQRRSAWRRKRRIQNWPRLYGIVPAPLWWPWVSMAPRAGEPPKTGRSPHPEAEVRQRKLRQQRYRALAGPAQIVAHPDGAVKTRLHERPAVEAVSDERLPRRTVREMVEPIKVRAGDLLGVLLGGTGEGV